MIRVKVNGFTFVDEKDPLEVYCINVLTEFNTYVIYKSIDAFTDLNENICLLVNANYKPSWISTFFCCSKRAAHGKDTIPMIQEYCDKLVKIYNHGSDSKEAIQLIDDFFGIKRNRSKVQKAASKIQKFLRFCRRRQKIKALLRLYYKRLGFVSSIDSLPSELLVNIFIYVPIKDRIKSLQLVSKKFSRVMDSKLIWKHVDLSPYRTRLTTTGFSKLANFMSRTKNLSLTYSFKVNTDFLQIINYSMSHSYLKVLKLGGNENITDSAVFTLTHGVPACTTAANGPTSLIHLSLSECKNITDAGIKCLVAYKRLKILNLTGCYNVTDAGITAIAQKLDKLKHVNLAGTDVTFNGVKELVNGCISLKTLNVLGCKKIDQPQIALYFKTHHINHPEEEDMLRFYLKPHRTTCLPMLFTNVLKTRRSLSVYRVIRYLMKKLKETPQFVTVEIKDSDFEILINDCVLPVEACLGEEERKLNESNENELKLHYRMAREIVDPELVKKDRINAERNYPPHPPLWIPKKVAYRCMNPLCGQEFGFFMRAQHCRNCGKCFCERCCAAKKRIPIFGYERPVKVCSTCYLLLP